MRKWKRISPLLLTLVCLFSIFGCDNVEKQKALAEAEQAKAQLVKLQETLGKTQSERDNFRAEADKLTKSLQEAKAELEKEIQTRDVLHGRFNEIIASHEELKKQVSQLTESRDDLKQEVEAISKVRDDLQKRADELVGFWMTALTDARNSQARAQELTAQVQRYVTDISVLNQRVAILQLSFVQLKDRLEQLKLIPARCM